MFSIHYYLNSRVTMDCQFRVSKSHRYALISVTLLLSACLGQSNQDTHNYYTWDGLEPDRWASIWLMKRHIDPVALISVVPVGAQISDAEPFVTPLAKIKRTHGKSTYENLLAAHIANQDPALKKLGLIINELEISPWSSTSEIVAVVERQFRALQVRYNRVNVPFTCYSGFFDMLYRALQTTAEIEQDSLSDNLSPDNVCSVDTRVIAKATTIPVLEYSTEYVLKMIAANKNVLFVDTREDEEFDERHIPGAINLKLREIDASVKSRFAKADLVISYCIKDFRAYEVALALHSIGVHRTGIMNPYGLKGWLDSGLPVTTRGVSESDSITKLKQVASYGATL